MILIAASDDTMTKQWREALMPCFSVYEVDIHDRRSLELCLKKGNIDVLVIDLAMLGKTGANEISVLKEIQPQLNIIAMVKHHNQREEITAVLFGAKAYCSFDMDMALLPKVVKTVQANELWVDRKFVSRLLSEIEVITQVKHSEAHRLNKGVSTMTPRETEIACYIAKGASNRKIAEQLNISERTVKAHLGVIFKKIGINDRLQLALYMNRHQQIAALWHGKLGHSLPSENESHRKH